MSPLVKYLLYKHKVPRNYIQGWAQPFLLIVSAEEGESGGSWSSLAN